MKNGALVKGALLHKKRKLPHTTTKRFLSMKRDICICTQISGKEW